MAPVDYALLAKQCYTDPPTVGNADGSGRMHVYGDVHCFRGSDNLSSWLHDVDIEPDKVWSLGKVHDGFYRALADILPACLALPRPTAVCGHSLGAALAILYAGVLLELGTVVQVFAFEPPRCCADMTLYSSFNQSALRFYATRNGNDIVTQLPKGFTIPGALTRIGHPSWPFDNAEDHKIERVVQALAQAA